MSEAFEGDTVHVDDAVREAHDQNDALELAHGGFRLTAEDAVYLESDVGGVGVPVQELLYGFDVVPPVGAGTANRQVKEVMRHLRTSL